MESNKTQRKIYYSGRRVGDQLSGTWKFKFAFTIVNKRLMFFPRSTGNWQMKKIEQ